MNHAFDTKALELSRQAIALFFEPMPGVQLQAKIQNLFIAAMEFAAPAVQDGQPLSQPYTLPEGYALVPVEPTIAMLDEFDSIIDYGADDSNDAWRRLLAAAWIKSLPAAPKQEAQEVKK